MNRERLPLAASLILLGLAAAATGLSMEEGSFLMLAGAAVVGIGVLTLLTHGAPNQVRSFDLAPPPAPRIPVGVEARVAWSGEGPPPESVRESLDKIGVKLEQAPVEEAESKETRVFTARLEDGAVRTNEDDLYDRGVAGSALVRTARNLGMELGDYTLVELVLRVNVEGRSPYMVKNLTMAPNDQLITVGRNMTLPVLVDPDDQMRLLVDWEAG